MTDKEKLIKIKKLADAMYYAAFNLTTDASLLKKAMNEYHQFVIHKYCKEEPVSDIESYQNRWGKSNGYLAEPVSEDLEEAAIMHFKDVMEYEIKTGLKMANITSFKAGAKWQITKLVEEAGKHEVKVDAGGYPYIPQIELYDYYKDVPLAKEGDKYSVILIKEG